MKDLTKVQEDIREETFKVILNYLRNKHSVGDDRADRDRAEFAVRLLESTVLT